MSCRISLAWIRQRTRNIGSLVMFCTADVDRAELPSLGERGFGPGASPRPFVLFLLLCPTTRSLTFQQHWKCLTAFEIRVLWRSVSILTAGETLEIGAHVSVKREDVPAFERYIAQLKVYYFDFRSVRQWSMRSCPCKHSPTPPIPHVHGVIP